VERYWSTSPLAGGPVRFITVPQPLGVHDPAGWPTRLAEIRRHLSCFLCRGRYPLLNCAQLSMRVSVKHIKLNYSQGSLRQKSNFTPIKSGDNRICNLALQTPWNLEHNEVSQKLSLMSVMALLTTFYFIHTVLKRFFKRLWGFTKNHHLLKDHFGNGALKNHHLEYYLRHLFWFFEQLFLKWFFKEPWFERFSVEPDMVSQRTTILRLFKTPL